MQRKINNPRDTTLHVVRGVFFLREGSNQEIYYQRYPYELTRIVRILCVSMYRYIETIKILDAKGDWLY